MRAAIPNNPISLTSRGFTDIRNINWPFAPIRVPILDWLPLYTRSEFMSDLIAGLTVFVLLIPQGW